MSAYRKFSDQLQALAPPKAAKAPKADPLWQRGANTLGGLGALGEGEREIPNFAPTPAAERRAPTTRGEVEADPAAIVEYDGGIPRIWAVGFTRLHPDRAPADVPPRRWERFVDDIGRFLDGPFGSVAAALGWGPFDLFGCDRDRPLARIDQAGLLWLLNGDKLVALSENTATIETQSGARQTFRRKPDEPGRTLAWELAP
jgi:hypothetical protein